MAALKIRLYGDPVLRRVARDVGLDEDVSALATDMIDAMYDAYGRGLAAPQVGECLRIFVMDCGWKDGALRTPLVFINPEVTDRSADVRTVDEGCLSLPGVPVQVTRPSEVTVHWRDLEGAAHQRLFTGFEAVCVQHETDHLDGILNIDHALPQDRPEIDRLLGEISA
ncbi:MAG: peptide deformylase [Pseudomonadota bacterium]